MVEELGNLIACYSKKKKKEKACNSISPFKLPTASNWWKHIGNNCEKFEQLTGQSEQSLFSVN